MVGSPLRSEEEQMDKRIYLAGPFFNRAQRSWIEMVEHTMDQAGVDYYSPRKTDHPPSQGESKGWTQDEAQEIFIENVAELTRCTTVLAIMDYLTDVSAMPVLCDHTKNPPDFTPLYLPDTGTVWELGAAYAMGKPIAALYTREEKSKTNLMLSQSWTWWLVGLLDLWRWLNEGESRVYQGGHR